MSPTRLASDSDVPPLLALDQRSRQRLGIVLVVALVLGAMLVVAAINRGTAPASDAWVPDCAPAQARDACEAEATARRFLDAWQAGDDVGPYVSERFEASTRRTPAGRISYQPSVTVTGDRAMVMLFLQDNGTLQVDLVREDGWRVLRAL